MQKILRTNTNQMEELRVKEDDGRKEVGETGNQKGWGCQDESKEGREVWSLDHEASVNTLL